MQARRTPTLMRINRRGIDGGDWLDSHWPKRIISILTPTPASIVFQARSAVRTLVPDRRAKARQARSPSDSPADRVNDSNNPAAEARSSSNGTMQIGSGPRMARISASLPPQRARCPTT